MSTTTTMLLYLRYGRMRITVSELADESRTFLLHYPADRLAATPATQGDRDS